MHLWWTDFGRRTATASTDEARPSLERMPLATRSRPSSGVRSRREVDRRLLWLDSPSARRACRCDEAVDRGRPDVAPDSSHHYTETVGVCLCDAVLTRIHAGSGPRIVRDGTGLLNLASAEHPRVLFPSSSASRPDRPVRRSLWMVVAYGDAGAHRGARRHDVDATGITQPSHTTHVGWEVYVRVREVATGSSSILERANFPFQARFFPEDLAASASSSPRRLRAGRRRQAPRLTAFVRLVTSEAEHQCRSRPSRLFRRTAPRHWEKDLDDRRRRTTYVVHCVSSSTAVAEDSIRRLVKATVERGWQPGSTRGAWARCSAANRSADSGSIPRLARSTPRRPAGHRGLSQPRIP